MDQQRQDFIASVCNAVSSCLNEHVEAVLYCGQDAYELLTQVFRRDFTESDLRAATAQHHRELAGAMSEMLEVPVDQAFAEEAVRSALWRWAGAWTGRRGKRKGGLAETLAHRHERR
ncbi:MAG: hypothetical protein HOW73_22570 [Polyangiaceae bacterium]|nr:hypothetical protein [Polyangiaceae bacterium]